MINPGGPIQQVPIQQQMPMQAQAVSPAPQAQRVASYGSNTQPTPSEFSRHPSISSNVSVLTPETSITTPGTPASPAAAPDGSYFQLCNHCKKGQS